MMMYQRELDELYKALAMNSYNCIYIIQNKKVQFINRHAEVYGGISADKVIGRMNPLSFVHPDDRATVRKNAKKMLKGQLSTPYEFRCCGRDGKIRWLLETVTPVNFRGKAAVLGNSMDISEIKEARSQIEEFKDLATSILNAIPHAIFGLQERKIIFVNEAVESVFGWTPRDLVGKPTRVLYRNDKECEGIRKKMHNTFKKQCNFIEPAFPCQRSDGSIITCRINAARIGNYLHQKKIVVTFEDITKQIIAETNLQERTKQLEIQARNLEEINTALNVLLRKREDDKKKIEENILSNVKELIMPSVEMIKIHKLDYKMRMFVEAIESSLNHITSPFLKTLSSKYLGLTPRELLIAGLLRDGKTTKEIANILSISVRGIEFHRENLRFKLGLKKKKENLVSYLNTLKLED